LLKLLFINFVEAPVDYTVTPHSELDDYSDHETTQEAEENT